MGRINVHVPIMSSFGIVSTGVLINDPSLIIYLFDQKAFLSEAGSY